ncbi:DMT family transporter [Pelagibacterium sediminicola]|uniref:DMT family transporter n=1 Tax=Pelagibacterium sediminicola TaxID=2248761 RepID=UPI000E30E411|nr:DMT family transporter [Pelagibacterium sediminicola]
MTAPIASPFAATSRNETIGLVLAALGAGFFATKGIFVKLVLADGLDALTILTWRMVLATPAFMVLGWSGLAARRRGRGKHGGTPVPVRAVLVAIGVGIVGYYGASYLDFAALSFISAQLNRLALLTYPFMVLILGAVLFGRRLSAGAVAAALLAYAGIAIIFAHDLTIEGDNVLTGTLLVLGAALAYALYQLFAKSAIDALGSALFTGIAMTAAGGTIFAHFLFTHPLTALAIEPATLLMLIGLAAIATVLPVLMIAAAIGRIGPERTAIFGNISPILTIVLAVVILNEPFTPYHGVGTVLVICGILLFTRLTRHRAVAQNPAA